MTVTLGDEVLDVYVEGDQCTVFVADQVIVLSAVASAIVAAVSGGVVALEDLAVALERRFGGPGEGSVLDATRELVEELAASGILRLGDAEPAK